MAGSSELPARPRPAPLRRALPALVVVVVIVVLGIIFPLFHVVPLAPAGVSAAAGTQASFDASAYAEKFWREKLGPAALHATDAATVLKALRRDAAAARQQAHQVGLGGTAYYFIRGTGRVIATDKNEIRVAVTGADGAEVALRVGPLFGNTLRDGTGLLNVNSFPGLAEFNALAAELNRVAETRVTAPLREQARVGVTLAFAGCAEAPEAVAPGPLLVIVPVEFHVEP